MVVSLQIGRALTDAEIAKRARALTATADVLTGRLGGASPQVGSYTSSPKTIIASVG